jgi:hypothetical protein
MSKSNKVHIDDLHFDHKVWKRELNFYKDELMVFQNRLDEVGQGNLDSSKLDSSKSIGEIRTIHDTGDFSIHGNQKVSTLEQAFHDTYGLNVQGWRKSGEIWLQTTATNEWTLSEQNHTGEEHKV